MRPTPLPTGPYPGPLSLAIRRPETVARSVQEPPPLPPPPAQRRRHLAASRPPLKRVFRTGLRLLSRFPTPLNWRPPRCYAKPRSSSGRGRALQLGWLQKTPCVQVQTSLGQWGVFGLREQASLVQRPGGTYRRNDDDKDKWVRITTMPFSCPRSVECVSVQQICPA